MMSLSYLWVAGNIDCTLVTLDGIERGEKKSAHFSDNSRIDALHFSRGERFDLYLSVKEEVKENIFTGFPESSRHGELSFSVFLPEMKRASYRGYKSFSLHPVEREQRFKWPDIAMNKGWSGRIGSVAIELSLTILT